jgi:diguanylate cyclase (GGDEF)-like protein/putative nucleotidyltransferase with HDIG domain
MVRAGATDEVCPDDHERLTWVSHRTQLYIGFVIALGATGFAVGMMQWSCADPLRFAFYFAATLLCSSFKVVLPGVPGNMSVFNVMVLVGVLQLNIGETLVMGAGAVLFQSYWRARKPPKPVQVAFNACSVAIAVHGAYLAYALAAQSSYTSHGGIRLAAAAVAYFLLNTASIALVIALTEGKPGHVVWRAYYFWTFPYYLLGASIAGAYDLASRVIDWQVGLLILPVVYGVFHSYRLYLTRLEQDKTHAQELAGLHLRTIEALALAIEAKDDTTHEHLRRVQVYAEELGKELSLTHAEMKALQAASILHDIGKLAVPDYIISKPGRLTPEEFEKMKIHPVVGAEILERVQFPYPVVPIVRHHHEKWDGSGYPDGLKCEEIPIGARILSAVDCLDALASDRQYRRALPLEKALDVVKSEAGKSFDPGVVDILARRAAELEKMARAQSGTEIPQKLSTDVKIERGLEPAAGFENADQEAPKAVTGSADFLETIAQARAEVLTVRHIMQELGTSLSLHETLALLGSRLRQLIPYDGMAIYIRKGDALHPAFVVGESNHLFGSLEIPVGQGLSGWVAENRKAIINGNPAVEPGYLNDPTKITRLRSALAVPLLDADGAGLGVLTLYHLGRDAFSKDHLRILSGLSTKLAIAIQNALRYHQAEQNNSVDELTGLPNSRALFRHLDSELSRCKRSSGELTVLVCELDGWKLVCDRFGHIAANNLLVRLAAKLQATCRDYDCVARMGGEEFVIVLPGFPADTVNQKIAELQRLALDAGTEVCAEPLLRIDIGPASFPADGVDAEDLLAQADRRMYLARQAAVRGLLERRIA